ncbi:LPXTG cell wall anchor domain-containing protein, partial [uncultured Streptococcus sp.]|uniref:LPXTG cell wall anchor domain-containing protein n=1 Tax=uncultured Streptococcus sp. TaxID=83427 RepID=UPI00259BD570
TKEPKTTVTSTKEPKTTVTSTKEPKTTVTSTKEPKSTPTKSTTKPNLSGTAATSKRPASNGGIKGDRKVFLPNTGEMVATGLVLTGALVLAGSVVMKRKLTKN